MITNLLFLCAGLLIGWNVLPQPEWVKRGFDKAFAFVVKVGGKLLSKILS